ncbi:MAG TPA: DUF3054 domain-containing protein [Anaerolineales bacterium]
MKKSSFSAPRMILLIGDTFILALMTLIGFFFHGTLGTGGGRLLTTFLPSLAAWLLIAPHLGAYDPQRAAQLRQVWRPFWAMLLSAPMAAWLRAIWLNTAVVPIFVVVFGGVNALAILLWRAIYGVAAGRRS